MILERTMSDDFLTNTFLLADEPGGSAVMIDAGGRLEPLLESIERQDLTLTHIILTHHHWDHICDLERVLERHPGTPVLAHPAERELTDKATADILPEQPLTVGGLRIEALHTPGHTSGMVALVVSHGDEQIVFTGDTLFKGSVGGVHAPGHTTYEDLKSSIMDTLMALPPETTVYPGHTDATTIGDEFEQNRFVRIWRGLDPEGTEACKANGEPATLVCFGDDYDGGYKAWVRWPDGADDLLPGSKIERG